MAGVFCDSFAHYDTSGIPLKWSTAGGSIQYDVDHIRTGNQSLQIQAGNAPTILNFGLPPDVTQTYVNPAPKFYNFAVGFAFQTSALNGTICALLRNLTNLPNPPELLLYLDLNSDGSLSLYTDGGTLLGSSAAGVITTGAFYYITISADIGGFSESTFATVTVVDSSLNLVTAISVTGFTLADQFIDEFDFDGPVSPDSAYINDFYFQDLSDGSTPPFAPNIYAVVPNGDGTPLSSWNNTDTAIWQPLSATHFNLVNSIPPNESEGLLFPEDPVYAPNPPNFIATCSQTFNFDCSALPDGRTIQSIQALFLGTYETEFSFPISPVFEFGFQENADGNLLVGEGNISPNPGMPFLYFLSENDLDPNDNPWEMSDWKNGIWQGGPISTTLF